MEKLERIHVNNETLLRVLSKSLREPIHRADYETKPLQGGTLGNAH